MNEADFHRIILDAIDALMEMDPAADSPEARLLSGLATVVEAYEKERFPIDPPRPCEYPCNCEYCRGEWKPGRKR